MILTPRTPTTAPGTSIPIANIAMRVTMDLDLNRVHVIVRMLDANGGTIQPGPGLRMMTPAECEAFLACPAVAGESPAQHLARAAAPYVHKVFGILYNAP